jgi:hypothetical protein
LPMAPRSRRCNDQPEVHSQYTERNRARSRLKGRPGSTRKPNVPPAGRRTVRLLTTQGNGRDRGPRAGTRPRVDVASSGGLKRPGVAGFCAVAAYQRSDLELISGGQDISCSARVLQSGSASHAYLTPPPTSSTAPTSTPRPTSSARGCSIPRRLAIRCPCRSSMPSLLASAARPGRPPPAARRRLQQPEPFGYRASTTGPSA